MDVFREVLEPLGKEDESIIGSAGVVAGEIIAGRVRIRKADSCGRFEVDHIGNSVPAIRVLCEGHVVFTFTSEDEGPVLVHEAVET